MTQQTLDLAPSLGPQLGGFHRAPKPTELSSAKAVYRKLPAQHLRVLEALQDAPRGLTGWQLAERLSMLRGSVSRATTMLERDGLIRTDGTRKEVATGATASVWVVTAGGIEQLRAAK